MFNPFEDLIPNQPQQPGPLIQGRPRQPTPRYEDEAMRSQYQAAASVHEPRKAEADARRAEAEARMAEAQLQQGGGTADFRAQQSQRRSSIEGASQRLLEVSRLYREGYQEEALGPISSLAEWMNLGPLTPGNQSFNAAGQGLTDAAMPIIRTPGVGAQSDLEARMFTDANRPRAANSDNANEVIFDNLQTRINAARNSVGLEPIDWRNPPAPANPPPGSARRDEGALAAVTNSGNQQRTLSDGRSNIEEDPVLRGVAQRIGAMLSGGASDEEVIGFMQQAGVNPADTSIREALQYRRTPDFRYWQQRNPGAAYPVGDSFFTREVPQTGARAILGAVANSGPGAYAINAGDALTLGTLDNMTDNPTQARAGMGAIRDQYPGSSLAGSISGAVMGGAGGEALLARMGMGGAAAMRGADALFGAGYGAGSSDEGSRIGGALAGTVAGLGGGMAGRAATRGAGRVATGARDAGVRYLNDRNIPMTLGQIAGQGGFVGRTVRSVEDKLESLPVLGDAIRQRRAQGVTAFNREAFGQALEPIGATAASEIGEQGVESAQASVSDAYSRALNGVQVAPDAKFVSELRRAVNIGARLPGEMSDHFRFVMQERVAPELSNGALTGDAFQALRQTLRQEAAAMKNQPRGRDYGNALREVERSLEGLVRRQRPDVVPALNQADQAYRRTGIVRDAVAAGQNTGGQFTPAQLGQQARRNAKKYGGTHGTTQQPFHELQRNAQDILPSQIPNSGTTDRAWATAALPVALGGAGVGLDMVSPETAGIMAALGLPFTPAGQRAFQKLLVSRPEVVRKAGERLIEQQRRGGRVGAGAIPMLPNYSN